MDSLVANIFLKLIILTYKLQTLITLSLFKISTLLVFLMSQNQSQNNIAWQLIRTVNWIQPLCMLAYLSSLFVQYLPTIIPPYSAYDLYAVLVVSLATSAPLS